MGHVVESAEIIPPGANVFLEVWNGTGVRSLASCVAIAFGIGYYEREILADDLNVGEVVLQVPIQGIRGLRGVTPGEDWHEEKCEGRNRHAVENVLRQHS